MIQSGTGLAMEIEKFFVGFKLEHLVGTILRKAPIDVVMNNTKMDHFQYKKWFRTALENSFSLGKGGGEGSYVSCFKYQINTSQLLTMVWKCHSYYHIAYGPLIAYARFLSLVRLSKHSFIHISLQMWKGQEANLKGFLSCALCKLLQNMGGGGDIHLYVQDSLNV